MAYPYKALKTLIDSDAGNAAKTDADVLAWCNAADGTTYNKDVPWEHFALWCARYNSINRMEALKSDPDADTASAAATALMVLSSGKDLLLSNSEIRAMMGNLVGAGGVKFSVAEKDNLLTFTDYTKTRCEGANIRAARMGDVMNARAL